MFALAANLSNIFVTPSGESGIIKRMLRKIRLISFIFLSAIALAAAAFALTTKEESVLAHFYELVFGSPDLGPVNFETFQRGDRPNNALACPADFCPNVKSVDFIPPIYPVSEDILRDLFTRRVLAEPHVIPVYRHEAPGLPTQDRYVQRTALMRFPDTVDVRFIPITETTSTLAIYSRSQIGQSDLGVNLARIRRWSDPVFLGIR